MCESWWKIRGKRTDAQRTRISEEDKDID